MLSEKEREFIRDYLKDGGGCSDDFRKKWSYDYERVLWHRIEKKYPKILRDLFLLFKVLSPYTGNVLFSEFMTGDACVDEEERRGLIAFEKYLSKFDRKN